MLRKERRHQFLINKTLQFRYMMTFSMVILVITFISLMSIYFGVWGEVLNAFSDERIQNDLLTASRLQEYDSARQTQVANPENFSTLSFFGQAERLSARQQEVFKNILNETNRNLAGKLVLLLLLTAAGTIFLSHKIAGPLYRFERILFDVTHGELTTRCYLRKFDEAKQVANAFNVALQSLDLRISRLKRIVHENEKRPDKAVSLLKDELANFKTSADS